MEENMIAYLKGQLRDYLWEEDRYGKDDRIVLKKYDALVACKQMVEALLQKPVYINRNGEVTVGF